MLRDFPVTTVLRQLDRYKMLPCILFRTSRKQCDSDVEAVGRNKNAHLSIEGQDGITESIKKAIEKYNLDETAIYNHPHYIPLIRTAIGGHHAGQLLAWRLLLEELMSQGLLRIMVATGTVAAGVDFPARTVVITAHSKRGSEGFRDLTSSEFQQMSGRAGRRGKDTVGFCLAAPGPYCDARVLAEVSKQPPEPLRSSYFASPSTVLNLLKYRNIDELKYTVSKSLAAYVDRRNAESLRSSAVEIESELSDYSGDRESKDFKKLAKRHRRKLREADQVEGKQLQHLAVSLEGLKALGHVDDNGLTEKGLWSAEMCTGSVLELAEAVDEHLLYDLQPEELVALIASISGDPYRTYLSIVKNPVDKKLFQKIEKCVNRVRKNYQGSPFASEIVVQQDAAVTVLTWYGTDDWLDFSGLLKLSGVTEGDAARLILQTADALNQLTHLRESHSTIATMAGDARRNLLKSPITDAYVTIE